VAFQRRSTEGAFRDLFQGEDYAAAAQRSWTGFEVNTGICKAPCAFHDHGPQPVKPATWPPPIEEILYECPQCEETLTEDELYPHMYKHPQLTETDT
jgi:hypothetical protein